MKKDNKKDNNKNNKNNGERDILDNSFNYYIGQKSLDEDSSNKQNDGKFD